jgi:hypothetical protein
MKNHLSPADYVTARFLMPEKIGRNYMTALARYSETQIMDSLMGEPFASDEAVNQVHQHGTPIIIHQRLRVIWFMLMERLAQYWLLEFFSQIHDQRLSIIDQMSN